MEAPNEALGLNHSPKEQNRKAGGGEFSNHPLGYREQAIEVHNETIRTVCQ